MSKTDFYARHGLSAAGTTRSNWGAIHRGSGKVLLCCWHDEVTKPLGFHLAPAGADHRASVGVLTDGDADQRSAGAKARVRTITEAMAGGRCNHLYVAISTGRYPDWMPKARTDVVYPVLRLERVEGGVAARLGGPEPVEDVFAAGPRL